MLSKYKALLGKYRVIIPIIVSNYIFKRLGAGEEPKEKFIIISRSRTGSNMLINYLSRIPRSNIRGEIMGIKRWIPFWNEIPDMFFGLHMKDYEIAGFKYFYYHPVDDYDSNNVLLDYILQHPEIKVIHWVREDLFAVILSRVIAVKSGQWVKTNKKVQLEEFEADEALFRSDLERTLSQLKFIRNLFLGRSNFKEFSYEDVVNRGKLSEIYSFLGYPNMDVEHSSKTSQRSAAKYDRISNLNKLREIYKNRMKSYNM